MRLGILVIPGTTRTRSRRTGLVPACSGGYVRPIERDRGAGGSASRAALNNQAPGRAEAGHRRRLNHVHIPRFTAVYGACADIVKGGRADIQIIRIDGVAVTIVGDRYGIRPATAAIRRGLNSETEGRDVSALFRKRTETIRSDVAFPTFRDITQSNTDYSISCP